MKTNKRFLYLLLPLTLGMLTACGDDDDDEMVVVVPPTPAPVNYTYEVSVLNLTPSPNEYDNVHCNSPYVH